MTEIYLLAHWPASQFQGPLSSTSLSSRGLLTGDIDSLY